jgi:transcriptional regulator with XRE-family HTH domain
MALLRRRRLRPFNQLKVLTQFLNHACLQQAVRQADLARYVKHSSISMVSRWFRGISDPTDEDLQQIAEFLNIPVANFKALQVIDLLHESRSSGIGVSLPAWQHMVEGSRSDLMMVGATMLSGVAPLREFPAEWLNRKTLLLSANDPTASFKHADPSVQTVSHSRWNAYWLAVVSSFLELTKKNNRLRIKLWHRTPGPFVVGNPPIIFPGQIVANDWIALLSSGPIDAVSYEVHFWGDETWQRILSPAFEAMKGDRAWSDHHLLWDSRWPISDKRYAAFRNMLKQSIGQLSPTGLLE